MEETSQTAAPAGGRLRAESSPTDDKDSNRDARALRWNPDAVRRLYEDAQWALTSNPAGEAEIAGILLGRRGAEVTITDCEPVLLMGPSDHSYALAGPGKREFQRMVSASQSIPERGLSVIGFYRSHLGDGFEVTEEDLELIEACFQDTSAVVLLIKPNRNGSAHIKLFFGNDAHPLSEVGSSQDASPLPTWLELWHNLSAEGRPKTDPPVDRTAPADTPPVPSPTGPFRVVARANVRSTERTEEEESPVLSKRRSNRTTTVLLAAATVLAVFAAYPLLKRPAELSRGTESSRGTALQTDSGGVGDSELALQVEKEGADLRLDWNRTAPMLGAATGGMLTIREAGGQEKQVMLDGSLLRTGSVIYRAIHEGVTIRLVVFGKDGVTLGEAVATYPKPKVQS